MQRGPDDGVVVPGAAVCRVQCLAAHQRILPANGTTSPEILVASCTDTSAGPGPCAHPDPSVHSALLVNAKASVHVSACLRHPARAHGPVRRRLPIWR